MDDDLNRSSNEDCDCHDESRLSSSSTMASSPRHSHDGPATSQTTLHPAPLSLRNSSGSNSKSIYNNHSSKRARAANEDSTRQSDAPSFHPSRRAPNPPRLPLRPRPVRVFVPLGRDSNGRPLYGLRTLEPAVSGASSPDWNNSANSSSETLADPAAGALWQLRDDGSIDGYPADFDLERGGFGSIHSPHSPWTPYSAGPRPLPPKKGGRLYRNLRWNFGSVYRRIFTIAFVANMAVILALGIRWAVHRNSAAITYQTASTAMAANILASLLVRNEHVVNALFHVFVVVPSRKGKLPLVIRRAFAKVYSYGGIHSGCGVAGTAWYLLYLGLVTADCVTRGTPTISSHIVLASWATAFNLVVIVAFAHPAMRRRFHNSFEWTHRFLGWSAVVLFWVQTLLVCADDVSRMGQPLGYVVARSPSFWMLVLITVLVIYPWTRLRIREVDAEPMSDHVIKLNFRYTDAQFGQAVRLSDSPLWETHAFAVIPHPTHEYLAELQRDKERREAANEKKPEAVSAPQPAADDEKKQLTSPSDSKKQDKTATPLDTLSHVGEKGFSVLVSNAGDWTSSIIRKPPTKIYTRGVPQYGVLRVAGLFRPCIVVATGSGIGPCLSLFIQNPDHPVRIVWSAKRPEETYGRAVLDAIRRADPDAVVIDTSAKGPDGKPAVRPDLVEVVWRVWEGSRWESANSRRAGYLTGGLGIRGNSRGDSQEERRRAKNAGPCEAVVIISNQKVTEKVVYGLESRGVPAYGAIFDS